MTRSYRLIAAIAVVPLAAAAGTACFSEHVTGQGTASTVDVAAICRTPSGAPANVVVISNFVFSPQAVRISAGGHVTWVNCETTPGLAHTSTSDGGLWQSSLMEPSDSFDRTFSQGGTFAYHCTPHPFMTGTVVVQ